jgi:hypothetical protein
MPPFHEMPDESVLGTENERKTEEQPEDKHDARAGRQPEIIGDQQAGA